MRNSSETCQGTTRIGDFEARNIKRPARQECCQKRLGCSRQGRSDPCARSRDLIVRKGHATCSSRSHGSTRPAPASSPCDCADTAAPSPKVVRGLRKRFNQQVQLELAHVVSCWITYMRTAIKTTAWPSVPPNTSILCCPRRRIWLPSPSPPLPAPAPPPAPPPPLGGGGGASILSHAWQTLPAPAPDGTANQNGGASADGMRSPTTHVCDTLSCARGRAADARAGSRRSQVHI